MAKFNWDELTLFAFSIRRIAWDSISTEALDRIAISRAYYGIFCMARRFLITHRHDHHFKQDDSEELIDKAANVHAYVINAFKNSPDEDEKELGDWLNDLRDWRNIADYNGKHGYLTSSNIGNALATAKIAQDLLNGM